MSGLIYTRGGIPAHVNGTATTAVDEWTWPGGPANYLWFRNAGAAPITLSFTRKDAAAGVGIAVAAGADRLLPAEIAGFYTQAGSSQAFEAVAFIRRG